MNSRDENPTSLSLLSGLRGHLPSAWDRLVDLYRPLVFSWCIRRGLQPADAEDVSQEVFRTVLTRIADFRREPAQGSFRGWLLTITRNKLGDYWRKRSSQPQAVGGSEVRGQLEQMPCDELLDDASSPEAAALYRRATDLIRSEFEESTWRAFWLVVCENRKPADVAAELNLTLNSVYLAKSRVLHRLRETLGDLSDEDDVPGDEMK
jgi:RNA polymerase sigma-70 factor (ECF subfamily)